MDDLEFGPSPPDPSSFAAGQWVEKRGGDYGAVGQIRGTPIDIGDGRIRHAVAIERITRGALIHIINPAQWMPINPPATYRMADEIARLRRALTNCQDAIAYAIEMQDASWLDNWNLSSEQAMRELKEFQQAQAAAISNQRGEA